MERKFSELVKCARVALGYSQQWLASEVGHQDRANIAHIESGKIIPGPKIFKRLVTVLKLNEEEAIRSVIQSRTDRMRAVYTARKLHERTMIHNEYGVNKQEPFSLSESFRT